MEKTKITGWILLFIGLSIIFYSLLASYNIFTNRQPVPTIFKTIEKEQIPPSVDKPLNSVEQIDKLLGEKLYEELIKILPVDFLPKILNLISWSTLALILILGGAQISSLGIKLIKD